jgi:hypothetical protein
MPAVVSRDCAKGKPLRSTVASVQVRLENWQSRLDEGDEPLVEEEEVFCVSSAATQTSFFLRDVQDQVPFALKVTPEIAGIGSQGLVAGRCPVLTNNLVCKQGHGLIIPEYGGTSQ